MIKLSKKIVVFRIFINRCIARTCINIEVAKVLEVRPENLFYVYLQYGIKAYMNGRYYDVELEEPLCDIVGGTHDLYRKTW